MGWKAPEEAEVHQAALGWAEALRRPGWRWMAAFVRRHLGRYLLGVGALVSVDLLQLAIPRVLGGVAQSYATGTLTEAGVGRAGLYLLAIALAMAAGRWAWRVLLLGASRELEAQLREQLFTHLQRMSPAYFQEHRVGELMAHLTNDVQAVRMAAGQGVVLAVDALFLTVAASLAMAVDVHPLLALLAGLPVAGAGVFLAWASRQVHRRAARVQEGFGRLSQFVEESVAGIRVVKVFGQEQARLEQFRRLAEEQQERQMELASVQSAAGPVTEGAVGLAFAALLGVGGPLVLAGRIDLGQFVAFAGYVGLLAWPLGSLGWLMNLWQRGSASWQRLQAILHTPPQLVDPPRVVAMPAPVRGHLEVRGLTFAYPGARRPALQDLSFQVRPGEVVAVTGPSGSGKSTLVQLLLRLWEPPEGSIFLDGVDVRRLPLQELRRHVAWVPQEGFLFSGTLADNIAFGSPESSAAGMPPAELERVGRLAGLHPDVEGFPDGYGSWVGEQGLALSGGQRQRVAIARALARRAVLFLLDDPFSSVDGDTEHRVLEGLLRELAGCTVLLVSHRISVVRRACRILVLHQGRLVEEGSHEELLALGGLYARMAALQRLEEELNSRPGPSTRLQEVCGGARPVEPAG